MYVLCPFTMCNDIHLPNEPATNSINRFCMALGGGGGSGSGSFLHQNRSICFTHACWQHWVDHTQVKKKCFLRLYLIINTTATQYHLAPQTFPRIDLSFKGAEAILVVCWNSRDRNGASNATHTTSLWNWALICWARLPLGDCHRKLLRRRAFVASAHRFYWSIAYQRERETQKLTRPFARIRALQRSLMLLYLIIVCTKKIIFYGCVVGFLQLQCFGNKY